MPAGKAGKAEPRRADRRRLLRVAVAAVAAVASVSVGGAAPAAASPLTAPLAWGLNNVGQLGNGTTTNSSTPMPVSLPAGTRVTAGSAGFDHNLALTSTGKVLAWGLNDHGQLGNGTTTNSSTPMPVSLPAGTWVTAIAGGGAHSLALTSTGKVLAWGLNDHGQVGDGTTTDRSVPVPVSLPAGATVRAIAAHGSHSMALTWTGQVLNWGDNTFGELGDGTTINRSTPVAALLPAGTWVTAIAAGASHSLAQTITGRVLAWGLNDFGQLGDGTTTNRSTPVAVLLPPGAWVTAIAARGDHSMARTLTGKVLGWGQNSFGQVGDGTTINRSTPVAVLLPPGIYVTAIAAGAQHSLALTASGKVLAWGLNDFGQVGDGTTINRSTPVAVLLPPGLRVTKLSAGGHHSLAIH